MAPLSEESVQRPEGEVAAEKKKQPEKAEDVAVELGPGGIEEFIENTEAEAGKEFTEFSGPVAGPELAAQTSDEQVKLSRDLETAREKAKTEVKAVEQEAVGEAAPAEAKAGVGKVLKEGAEEHSVPEGPAAEVQPESLSDIASYPALQKMHDTMMATKAQAERAKAEAQGMPEGDAKRRAEIMAEQVGQMAALMEKTVADIRAERMRLKARQAEAGRKKRVEEVAGQPEPAESGQKDDELAEMVMGLSDQKIAEGQQKNDELERRMTEMAALKARLEKEDADFQAKQVEERAARQAAYAAERAAKEKEFAEREAVMEAEIKAHEATEEARIESEYQARMAAIAAEEAARRENIESRAAARGASTGAAEEATAAKPAEATPAPSVEKPVEAATTTQETRPAVAEKKLNPEQIKEKLKALAEKAKGMFISPAELALKDPAVILAEKKKIFYALSAEFIEDTPEEVFTTPEGEAFDAALIEYGRYLDRISMNTTGDIAEGGVLKNLRPEKISPVDYAYNADKLAAVLGSLGATVKVESAPAPAAETKPAKKPIEAAPAKAPEVPSLESVSPVVPDSVVVSPEPVVPETAAKPVEPALPHIPDLVMPEVAAAQAAEKKAAEESVDAGFDALHAEAMPQTAEAKAQARMAEILQEMDGLRMEIKENPANKQALMQRRQALALEGRGVQDSIKKLKQEALVAQNQAELDEIDAGFTEMHEEAMGAEAKQFEALKTARSELMSIAKDLEANGGKITDDMANRFKLLRNRIDDLEKSGAPAKNLQEMMHHFGMIMNSETSPDEATRLGGLKEFFNENPEEEEAPKAETEEEAFARMAKEADAAHKERMKQEELAKRQQEKLKIPELADISGLVDVVSSAPEIGESEYKGFFEDYNGAEYGMAQKKLDAVMGQRDAKIKELMAQKPENEPHKKKIQEQIACLKLANQISAMRKEQWAKQDQLFKGQKAIDLISTDVAETQDELTEVNSMLEGNPNDPNLLKRKDRLEQQLEFQGRELALHVNSQDKLKNEITGIGNEINLGLAALEGLKKDVNKPPDEEEIKPRPTGPSAMLPEEMLEKGINRLAAGLTEWMSHDDIGDMAFGAVGKIFSALEWAVDKIPGGTKAGAEAAKKKG